MQNYRELYLIKEFYSRHRSIIEAFRSGSMGKGTGILAVEVSGESTRTVI